jgi:hypothetical protein
MASRVHLQIDGSHPLRDFTLQKSQISTLSKMILFEAHDLLMRVSHRLMDVIPLGLWTSEISTLNFHFPSKCADLCRVSS